MNINRLPEKGRAAASQSLNATFNSAAFLIERLKAVSLISVLVETSATLGGTLKLQHSNNAFMDNTGLEENATATWVDVPLITEAVSGSETVSWNITDANWEAVRVVWTRTSGQGTGQFFWLAKEF